jgi:hypothetical protein
MRERRRETRRRLKGSKAFSQGCFDFPERTHQARTHSSPQEAALWTDLIAQFTSYREHICEFVPETKEHCPRPPYETVSCGFTRIDGIPENSHVLPDQPVVYNGTGNAGFSTWRLHYLLHQL